MNSALVPRRVDTLLLTDGELAVYRYEHYDLRTHEHNVVLRSFYIWLPFWLPAVAFAAFPTSRLVALIMRRRRPKPGHCPA